MTDEAMSSVKYADPNTPHENNARPPEYAHHNVAPSAETTGTTGQPLGKPTAKQQPEVIIITPPIVIVGGIGTVGHLSTQITCPNCSHVVFTTVTYKVGLLTWIVAGGLFVFGCWPFCIIPFCCNSTKDTIHTCPSCNAVVGRFSIV